MAGANGELLVAGSYTATLNSLALGITLGDDGVPTISVQTHSEPINNTDRYFKTRIDSIDAGMDYGFEAILAEWTHALALLSGYCGTLGLQSVPGRFKSSIATALVLTAVAGTSASAAPATITANKAVLDDEFQTKIKFGPMLRTVPIKLALLPYPVGSAPVVITNYTVT